MSTLSEIEGWIMAADVQPKRNIAERVRERAKEGKCLHCDEVAVRRGLCFQHYHQFRTNLLKMPRSKRAIFISESIRDGKVLHSRQGQRLHTVDVFAEVAERVGA